MKPTVKIAAFIGILAVAFLLAFGVGRITAPSSSEAGQHNPMPEHTAQESGMAMSPNQAGNIPGGLMVSEQGYTLKLSNNNFAPGAAVPFSFSIEGPDGQPVTDLEPYLGAYGHLVALREGDLAYLHVHPSGAPGDGKTSAGPTITFTASVPSAGSYQLYLGFKHGGKVRTAHFSVTAGESTGSASPPASSTTPSANPHSGH